MVQETMIKTGQCFKIDFFMILFEYHTLSHDLSQLFGHCSSLYLNPTPADLGPPSWSLLLFVYTSSPSPPLLSFCPLQHFPQAGKNTIFNVIQTPHLYVTDRYSAVKKYLPPSLFLFLFFFCIFVTLKCFRSSNKF